MALDKVTDVPRASRTGPRVLAGLQVGAGVAVCAVCCPPLLLVPLALLGGVGAGLTATTVLLGAPVWLVTLLFLLTVGALTAWARRRRARRALTITDVNGVAMTSPAFVRLDDAVRP